MKKIYIAGRVTGYPEYREHFKREEDKLIAEGHVCMNPSVLGEGFPWEIYMPICYAMIYACDTIYLLSNWQDSRGAKLEYDYAVEHGLEIMFEDGESMDKFKLMSKAELSEKKQNKVDETRKFLDDKGIIYKEMQYGQFQVDKANYWATTEKWHDPVRKEKGVGLNSFLTHLKKNNIIA